MNQPKCKHCKTQLIKFIGIKIDKDKKRYRQYQCLKCNLFTRIEIKKKENIDES